MGDRQALYRSINRYRQLFQELVLAALKIAVAMVALAQPSLAKTNWSPDEIAQLKSGDAVVRVTAAAAPADGDVRGAIDIAAPAAQVWAVLFDCAGARTFMENLKSCKIVEQGPGGAWDVREHIVQWTVFLPQVRSEFRSDYVKDQSIWFKRTGGDLNFLEGSWQLQPLAGGKATRIHYEAQVGFSILIPGMLVRNALERDVPHLLGVIRREAMRRAQGKEERAGEH